MSLTKKDLLNIKGVVDTSILSFWELILEPNLVSKKEFKDTLDERFKEHTVVTAQMIDNARDSINKEINNASGNSVLRDRTLNQKSDITAELLEQKNIFEHSDTTRVKNISPFPSSPLTSQ